ncbi:MAG: TetR/AcrR family transcriptional regulator [Bacilli bacterium]
MSYRHLDNIDEKIIDATILVGSANGANKLSTKAIAKVCDISEFVIYDHFKSKEHLLSSADLKVSQAFNDAASVAYEANPDFIAFWNAMVDYSLANASYTSFSINYGYFFPRTSKPQDYDEFSQNIIYPFAKTILEKWGVYFNKEYLYSYNWMWLVRSVLTYAQFVIGKSLEDTAEIRNFSCLLAHKGYLAFAQHE